MITSKELLANGWERKFTLWFHPKSWMRRVENGKKILVSHTLAQARWAQEHILEKS